MKLSLDARFDLNDGRSIPVLGFGTFLLVPGDESYRSVEWALRAGYRHVDTATVYGNEADVARGVYASKVKRADVFLTTKLRNTHHGHIENSLRESLRLLGTAFLDLYLIHWPVDERNASWKTFEKLKTAGLTRSIGVSNFTISHLESLLAQSGSNVVPAVNQVEFAPWNYQKELHAFCTRHGIVIESHSTLARGAKLSDPVILDIAAKHGKTAAQVIIRWDLQHGVVPLPRSKTKEHIEQNADVFTFTLSPKDMQRLNGLDEGYFACPNPATRRMVDGAWIGG